MADEWGMVIERMIFLLVVFSNLRDGAFCAIFTAGCFDGVVFSDMAY